MLTFPDRQEAVSTARRSTALGGLLVAVLCLAHTPAATAQDLLLDRARSIMGQNRPVEAYRLLEPEELQRADDAAFSYLFGIAALDAGELTRAIFALERVLEMEPQNNLARAELARAYLAAGEAASARKEFRIARQGNMPAGAAAAIDRVLSSLDQDPVEAPGRSLRGYLEMSAGRDSNVNSATTAGQFALPAFGGIVFNLAPQNQQRADSFASLAGGVSVQLPLAPLWAVSGAVNVRSVHNRSAHEVDSRQADGNLAFTYSPGRNAFTLAVQGNTYAVDSQTFRNAAGFSGQWQHVLDTASQVGTFVQWSRLKYAADASRDADRTVFGASYARSFQGGQRIAYASIYAADENAKAGGFEHYGHKATGLRVGGEISLGSSATLFSALQYESRRYGGTEPFFEATRRDRQKDVVVGVHFVPAPQWRITPQVMYLRAASNVVLYDYSRTVFQISARREFK